MPHILPGFKLDPQGRVMKRMFSPEQFPAGWVDSPDKLFAQTEPPVEKKVEPVKEKPIHLPLGGFKDDEGLGL